MEDNSRIEPSSLKKRVIILEEHPFIVDGLKHFLHTTNKYVLAGHATNKKEMVSMLETPAELLIFEINNRGENMLEFIPEIKKRQPQIKAVVFSAYNAPGLVRKAIDCKVDGYILKNTSREEFLDALDYVGSGKKYFGKSVLSPGKVAASNITDSSIKAGFEKKHELTKRETDIIRLMAKGLESKEIAAKLFISAHTVHSHRKNIMRKLDLHTLVDIVRFVIDNGLDD